MKIINKSRGTTLAEQGYLANSFYKRLRGLIGKGTLKEGEGFVIRPCSSIHTFFMSFNIDVIFINSKGAVEKILEGLKPFRMAACFFRSKAVIELPEGIIKAARTSVGDKILLQSERGIYHEV